MEMQDLGKTPISDESPAGQDVRYEPSFESLSQEIAKLGSPSASSGINWQAVIDLSVQILEKESKHLQVASYLSYGLLKTQGIEGLATGIHILKELLENFWAQMFPPKKRMKGRRGIIEWWSEKVADFVSGIEPVTWEKPMRDTMMDELSFIDEFLSENMPDAPMLLPLTRQIQDVILEAAEPEPEPAPEPEPPAPEPPAPEPPVKETATPAPQPASPAKPPAAPAAQPVAAPDIAPDADYSQILNQGLGFLGKLASELRKADKFNPLPYRLSRMAAWSGIDSLPSATGGKTLIPPPNSQIISAIVNLYDAGNWDALADSCEGNVKQFLFWLDLSRYVAEGMEQLGHNNVARVVEIETQLFVEQFKGIETLSFSDGTPFADDGTRQWLAQLSSGAAGGGGSAASGAADETAQLISEQTIKAQQLIKEKKPDAALELLNESLCRAVSQRERFMWKTAVCRVLIQIKQVKIAASYIDDILNSIDRYHLDDWEPQQAVDALSLVLTGLRLLKDNSKNEVMEAVIKRISMIDPVKAIQVV